MTDLKFAQELGREVEWIVSASKELGEAAADSGCGILIVARSLPTHVTLTTSPGCTANSPGCNHSIFLFLVDPTSKVAPNWLEVVVLVG